MADAVVLEVQPRKSRGTREAKQLRRKGLIPAVLYGHKEATVSMTLAEEGLAKAIRHGTRIVDLKVEGQLQKALIREVQWDYLGKELLHVDFARVAADERVVVEVPLELRGQSPGVTAGGVLDQPIHSIKIECLAISLPDNIRVNIGELQLDAAIHIRDLVLPAGVKVLDDPEQIVVAVKTKQEEGEAPVAGAAAGEQAEPEVITRAKPAEAEEEK